MWEAGGGAGKGQTGPASGGGREEGGGRREEDVSSVPGHAGPDTALFIGQNIWVTTTSHGQLTMCEADSVEYLRDLVQEKDNLDKLDGHHIIKSLLNQGKIICN